MRSLVAKRIAAIALSFLTSCAPVPQDPPPARALGLNTALPPMRTFAPQHVSGPSRANSEIMEDFLDLTFRMESGRLIPRMTRFEAPVSVRVVGEIPPHMIDDLRALLQRLRNEAGIDIFLTGADTASITIQAIPSETLQRAVPRAACFVVPRISSWDEFLTARRTPQVDWATLSRRDRAAIFVPSDVAPQEIRDCMHEELAQALGPLNDLYRLPDSVFNDDNIHAVLTPFDMTILRAYYAPELQNGMTQGEVAARLPALLARLNPAGQSRSGIPLNDTTRDWIESMETALSSGPSQMARRTAAERAVMLANNFNWDGTRRGFAHYAHGRLQVGTAPNRAYASFQAADAAYASSDNTRIHRAHVAVQLAAFALSEGDAAEVLRLVGYAIPQAAQHENAALLATLMMFQAEALEIEGRFSEAQAVRLDSLGWARYGFGDERNVRARQREIAALRPWLRG
ncbi:DUF2927 domain-containing protein [Aestuariibius sp. HNIBRBA575]|uniref:DUF2927 domain-containing protein n=1 Tax=Aestuariibius sp. HNIBRBA575 TaxID=3233343 RepID=UPI0034A2EE6D